MAYTEDDLLPLSALQHLVFCERQCALIHIEQVWAENRLTAEGRILHERVDEGGRNWRGDVRVAYGIPLRSFRLGLSGRADVVEFHPEGEHWRPYPVEYKRGKPKPDSCDLVQLCAQGLCLEEMLDTPVPSGAMFYGQPRRRLDVEFDDPLRALVAESAEKLHRLFDLGVTPPPVYARKCDSCSLLELCLPKAVGGRKSATKYLEKSFRSL